MWQTRRLGEKDTATEHIENSLHYITVYHGGVRLCLPYYVKAQLWNQRWNAGLQTRAEGLDHGERSVSALKERDPQIIRSAAIFVSVILKQQQPYLRFTVKIQSMKG